MSPERYRRIKEIFLRATELEGDSRDEFVTQECEGDAVLRAEVESLMQRSETVLSTLPFPPRPRTTRDPMLDASGKRQHISARHIARNAVWIFASHVRRGWLAVVALILVVSLGVWVLDGIRKSVRNTLAEELNTLNAAIEEALCLWVEEKLADAQVWADQPNVRENVMELAATAASNGGPRESLRASPALTRLQTVLDVFDEEGFSRFAVVDRNGWVLAAHLEEYVGTRLTPAGVANIIDTFDRMTVFTAPRSEDSLLVGHSPSDGAPIVWFSAPVRDENDAVIASLSFGTPADGGFSASLAMGTFGESGETYAFDKAGMMLSDSRFNPQLRSLGLIPRQPNSRSILNVSIRDPGGDLSDGHMPDTPASARPLTRMAAMATSGHDGVDVQGYRDYRGIKVVGAWKWLDQYDIGIATEVDYEEAYALRWYPITAAWVLFAFLIACFLGLLWAAYRIAHLRRQIGEAMHLGQYVLEHKIGEGGFGVVYKARHSMLRRPSAIKLLRPDLFSDEVGRYFQREVQLASQLTHPNTIEIYDYGRTREGVLYFSMEYLPGVSLDELVRVHGSLPPARTVSILKQVCQSLQEAHNLGVIHRDIKPQNIMVCERGGLADFVKVLDFGLAKDIRSSPATVTATVAGTPLYMAPERLNDPANVDARSDLYSVGCVGFYLLTGRHVFECTDGAKVLHHILNEPPKRPSEVVNSLIPTDLDDLILSCLAKAPSDRPQSAAEVLSVLQRLRLTHRWTHEDAETWWSSATEQRS